MKRLLLILVLTLLCFTLMAEAEVLTYLWDWDDFDVAYFRYQLDTQEEDGWTVVEYYETSATFENLDLTIPHFLYLQQSYDGINWSESSMMESELLAPSVEESLITEEEALHSETEVEAQAEAAADSAAEAPAEVAYVPKYDLGMRVTLKSYLTPTSAKYLTGGVSFGMPNLKALGKTINLGFKINTSVALRLEKPLKAYCINLTALSRFSMKFSEKLYLGLSIGAEAALDLRSETAFGYGGSAGVFLNFAFKKHFGIELEALFHILTTEQSFDAGLIVSYKF